MRVIRYPDGTVRSIYDRIFTDKFYIHEDMIYQYGAEKSIADKLQTEESKALELVNDYPVKAWYASFEAYCEEHRATFRIVKDCGATPIIQRQVGLVADRRPFLQKLPGEGGSGGLHHLL